MKLRGLGRPVNDTGAVAQQVSRPTDPESVEVRIEGCNTPIDPSDLKAASDDFPTLRVAVYPLGRVAGPRNNPLRSGNHRARIGPNRAPRPQRGFAAGNVRDFAPQKQCDMSASSSRAMGPTDRGQPIEGRAPILGGVDSSQLDGVLIAIRQPARPDPNRSSGLYLADADRIPLCQRRLNPGLGRVETRTRLECAGTSPILLASDEIAADDEGSDYDHGEDRSGGRKTAISLVASYFFHG